MLGVLLALLAAVAWGVGSAIVKVALQDMRASTGTLISLVAGFFLVAPITLLFDPQGVSSMSWTAVFWFALVGIVNYSLARYFTVTGIMHIGSARASTIVGTSPFFGIVLAIMFLNEKLTLYLALGTVLILAGSYLMVGGSSE